MGIRTLKRSAWTGILALLCAVAPRYAHADGSATPAVAEARYEEGPAALTPSRLIDQDVEKKPVPSEAATPNSARTVGYVLLGAGVVGLGVGSYFGLHAFSKWSERKNNCTGGCTPDAKSAGDSAQSAASISDIGFGVGLIAAGVGSYLILSSKSSEPGSATRCAPREAHASLELVPVLGAGGGGLWLRGDY